MSQRRPNSPNLITTEFPESKMLLVVAGFSDDPDGLSLEYLQKNQTWLSGPNLPYQLSYASSVEIGMEIFVLGILKLIL